MQIDHRQLSAEALRGLIEEFVTREGTEYGEVEVDLDTKCRQVVAQLERGDVSIDFDPDTGTTSIVPRDGI